MSEKEKRSEPFAKIALGLSQIIDFLLGPDAVTPLRRGRREEGGVVFEYSFRKRGILEETGEGERPQPGAQARPRSRLRRRESAGPEILEPVTDLFDEPDEIVLLFELPGVKRKNLRVRLSDDIFLLEAQSRGRLFRKEIRIEARLRPGAPRLELRNGILEVRLKKETKPRKENPKASRKPEGGSDKARWRD